MLSQCCFLVVDSMSGIVLISDVGPTLAQGRLYHIGFMPADNVEPTFGSSQKTILALCCDQRLFLVGKSSAICCFLTYRTSVL